MDNAIEYLELALKLAPLVIEAGEDIGAFAKQVYSVISKKVDPTDADWQALTDKETEMRTILQAPLDGGTNA